MRAVLADLSTHVVQFGLLFLVGALLARRFSAHMAALVAGGLALFGVVSYAVGAIWYLSPEVGIWTSRSVPLLSAVVLILAAVRLRPVLVEVVRSVAVPFVLTVLYATTILGLGFMYGGYGTATDTAAGRFSWLLPIDNTLPYRFASHIEQFGHSIPAPHIGDWLSSDRPPLQSAIMLSQVLWHKDGAAALLDYQVLGTLLQSMWVLGLWALIHALVVRRATVALCIASAAGCGVIMLNTFFVWPKLLAAAFALASAALILTGDPRRSTLRLTGAAVLASLAYLSHGGTMFVLVPLAVLALVRALQGRHWWATVTCAAMSAMALVLPWTWYQRVVDPPGDRLLKQMLANVMAVDPRSPVTAIADQYRAAGWSGTAANKLQNLEQLFMNSHRTTQTAQGISYFQAVISVIREQYFFSLVPAAGLLLILAFGWVRPHLAYRKDLRAATILLLAAATCALFWCLAMFGPRTTFTHQGTFTLVLLLTSALTCAGAARSIRVTTVVVAASAIISLVVYVPQFPIGSLPWTLHPQVSAFALGIFALGLVAFVALLWAYGSSGQSSPTVETLPQSRELVGRAR
jgi:hypothetical protein